MTDNKPPVEVLRDNQIKASIWENEGDKGIFYTTTISRSYKGDDGKYYDTNGFSGQDLLVVSEISRQAYQAISELKRQNYRDQKQSQTRETSSDARDDGASRVFKRGNGQSRSRQPRR